MADADSAARARAARLAQQFEAVFATDVRGRDCLAHLEVLFVKPAVVKGGIDAVLETYRGIGHREVLDYIHSQIERASQFAEPTETPTLRTE